LFAACHGGHAHRHGVRNGDNGSLCLTVKVPAPMKKLLFALGCGFSLAVAGCASVRPTDLQAWVGAPVSELDTHPIFLTMPVVRTQTADGTEIRDYVNGRNVQACAGSGSIFTSTVNAATYGQFSSCMQSFAACHNIFNIKDGRVTRYTPIGSGGARCYTDERDRPGFNQPTNY